MVKIIGVRFRNAGKVYYFDPLDLPIRRGDSVIVETARGVECGKAVFAPREVEDGKVVQPLRPVTRIATEEDLEREARNLEKEKEAFQICQQKIREHGLDMKLIQAEYTFDNKKVLFYFTANGRVDFRNLVKDLASVFRTRIELRQIGVRDETKMLGGIGVCGRPLCCSTYLTDFAPVSIKMAKEQNLSLNPSKISGVCGRLLCCLKNEQETYEYLNKNLPGAGDLVEVPGGTIGEVQTVNVLRQTVRVLIEQGDDKEIVEYPAGDLTIAVKRKKRNREKERQMREQAQAEREQQREASRQKDRHERHERSARRDRREHPEKDGSSGETAMKNGRGERNERSAQRPERGAEKSERSFQKPERGAEKSERSAQKPERGTEKSERSAQKPEGGAEKSEHSSRSGRRRRRRKSGNRQAAGEGGSGSSHE